MSMLICERRVLSQHETRPSCQAEAKQLYRQSDCQLFSQEVVTGARMIWIFSRRGSYSEYLGRGMLGDLIFRLFKGQAQKDKGIS